MAEHDQNQSNEAPEKPEPENPPERMFYVMPDMAQMLSEELVRSFGQPRSSGWSKLRDEWIKDYPQCAVCGTKNGCVPHHVEPFHVNPALELDRNNLITLCPPHHLLIGHLMNWASYNSYVRHDANYWLSKIARRPQHDIRLPEEPSEGG